jgi:prepilin-type N-terminal cleavage/methylation domain-containing protein
VIFQTNKVALTGDKSKIGGFTLVEMLVVLAIMSILSVLIAVSFAGILSAGYDSELSNFASLLTRARAYAIANNSYVYVGIEEIDSTVSPNAVPQTAALTTRDTGGGAIAVAIISTSDGSRGYDPTDQNLSNSPSAQTPVPNNPTFTSATPVVVSPVQVFNNLHILFCNPGDANELVGSLAVNSSTPSGLPPAGKGINLGNTATDTTGGMSALTFSWPMPGPGQTLTSSPKYTFSQVIQFNPQGEAQIINGPNVDGLLQYIEIDLEPMQGKALPNSQESNSAAHNNAAIVIDGVSGSVRIFRS